MQGTEIIDKVDVDTRVHDNNIKKERDLNFELLRVISAIFIVASHFACYGGSLILYNKLVPNLVVGELLFMLGSYGVNCFALISGYYLVNSKFKVKNLLKVILAVLFYSIGFYIIARYFNLTDGSISNLLKNIFPISYGAYWFATAYVGMYILFPFVNLIINNMTQRMHRNLIIILTVMISLISTILFNATPSYYNDLTFLIYLYLISAYIRRYDIKINDNKKVFLLIILLIIFIVIMQSLYTSIGINKNGAIVIAKQFGLPTIILSVLTFLLFKNIKISKGKIIQFLAKASFGVYLIHTNVHMVRIIFDKIIGIENYYFVNVGKVILCVIIGTIGIYVSCVVIDTIRRKLLEEPLFKTKAFNGLCNKIDSFMNLNE